MIALPPFSSKVSAVQACALLEKASWRRVGAGDWSWVFADAGDEWAVRVTPFDPGYEMFAHDCLDGPANRWLPNVVEVFPLLREGYVVLMERLWPAEERAASSFCAALGIANDTGYGPPTPGPEVEGDEPDLVALRTRILRLLSDGQTRYLLWAGSDIREGNVMVDRQGQLKLVDPVGVAGWKIVEALANGRVDLLRDFSRSQLEDFLSIPYFGPRREGYGERRGLLAKVARLYGAAEA